MGVPKFYRWISERYPCLSEVVKDYQIPDFDNLYLDMNGIIHNCSHPNDDDPHFRISENDIFLNIFHYIEFLFRMIKPRKVFFMAVDGVAPRAKMNQQRGRRFRAAREAEAKEKEAIAKGETLPTEDRFDSNCITPGTEFMNRLNEQLKYFVSMKISTDKLWQGVNVYLSGHETPGEGEHKIMDYIRYKRSQPDYDPDTKHCLYGLDADLIMLGLCSHEPHFSLLREEVKFGSKNQKKSFLPENITFHLLHLSLMREYLEHEFSPVKKHLTFPFDLEAIIDDWVLMGFLVGNDFIPNIPQMHIQNDALPILYSSYIEVLPTLGGYINEGGFLNLERFQKYLNKLGQIDREKFSDVLADLKYFEAKCTRPKRDAAYDDDAGFLDVLGTDSNKMESNNEVAVGKLLDLDTGDCYDTEEDLLSEDSDGMLDMEFSQHKRDYYMNKLDYENITKEVLKEQAYEFVRAIQWNLHYYYNGIASWSWYYPHHYAPYISDVTDFSEIKLDFELGNPFLPYEQLLAVLPAASKKLLPLPFQSLMISENSPVKNYYPEDFKTDLNGKQQEWEAVVLIPFINEKLLLNSMSPLLNQLTDEEKKRNSHGPHILFKYTPEPLGPYKSINPSVFPDISFNHAMVEEIPKDGFLLPRSKILKGLCPGVRLEVYFPGFPTLRHIEHTAELKNEKVKVFQMVSRKENMMLTVKEPEKITLEEAAQLIDKIVFVAWPHLTEAKVYAVSDGTSSITGVNGTPHPLNNNEKQSFSKQCNMIKERQYERFGIVLKNIPILVHVNLLNGVRFVCKSDGTVVKDKIWSDISTPIAYQVMVKELAVEQPNIRNFSSIEELFPPETVCFMMSYANHGHEARVIKKIEIEAQSEVKLEVKLISPVEPDFSYVISNEKSLTTNSYYRGNILAQRLGISSFMVSRFTGTFFVQINSLESLNPTKINIGLNLKFNKRNEEVFGYSKKTSDGVWLYSQKTLETMEEYLTKFPELFEAAYAVLEQDVVHVDSLFPTATGKDYIKNVKIWLDSLPYTTKERQQCGAIVLDLAVVEELEKILKETEDSRKDKPSKIIQVSPKDLFRPHSIHGSSAPDPKTNFRLYDRVVHIQEGSSVPLGLRGTLVGIHKAEAESDTMVDVLFDEEFAGALTLFSTSRRGYRLRPCTLINLTHGRRMISSSSPAKMVTSSRNNATGVSTSTSIANSVNNNESRRHNRGHDVPSNSRLYSKALSGIVQAPNRSSGEKTPQSPTKKPQMTILSHKSEASKQQTKTRMAKLKEMSSSSSSSSSPKHVEESMKAAAKNREDQGTPTNNPSVNQFNHSPDSPFVPRNAGWNNSFNFDSPSPDNVQQLSRSTSSSSKATTQSSSSFDNEFMSIWDGLKQIAVPLDTQQSKVVPSAQATTPGVYGKPVSVQELFQTARQAETLNSTVPPQPQPPQPQPPVPTSSSNCTQLLNLMLNSNRGIASYSFAVNGPNSVIATVTLPSGERFPSVPCSTNQIAAENAAEQALVYLSSLNQNSWNILTNAGSFPRPNLPPAFGTNIASVRPTIQHQSHFSPRRTTMSTANFPAPVSLAMAAAALPKFSSHLTGTRHPPPSSLVAIPDNFVEINEQRLKQKEQQMLEQAMQNPTPNFFYTPNAPLNPQHVMDMNAAAQFHHRQQQQHKPHSKGNVYQGNMGHQQQQFQGFPGQGHARGNNWAKGWQPSSPNKRNGNDERSNRGQNNSRQFHNLQGKETYQAQPKSNDKNFDQQQQQQPAPSVSKTDKFDFIPSQVARNQAGGSSSTSSQSKSNGKTEGNKTSIVKQMDDLTITATPDVVQKVNVKQNESAEPVISQPKRKSRLAVNFKKPQSS